MYDSHLQEYDSVNHMLHFLLLYCYKHTLSPLINFSPVKVQAKKMTECFSVSSHKSDASIW